MKLKEAQKILNLYLENKEEFKKQIFIQHQTKMSKRFSMGVFATSILAILSISAVFLTLSTSMPLAIANIVISAVCCGLGAIFYAKDKNTDTTGRTLEPDYYDFSVSNLKLAEKLAKEKYSEAFETMQKEKGQDFDPLHVFPTTLECNSPKLPKIMLEDKQSFQTEETLENMPKN